MCIHVHQLSCALGMASLWHQCQVPCAPANAGSESLHTSCHLTTAVLCAARALTSDRTLKGGTIHMWRHIERGTESVSKGVQCTWHAAVLQPAALCSGCVNTGLTHPKPDWAGIKTSSSTQGTTYSQHLQLLLVLTGAIMSTQLVWAACVGPSMLFSGCTMAAHLSSCHIPWIPDKRLWCGQHCGIILPPQTTLSHKSGNA